MPPEEVVPFVYRPIQGQPIPAGFGDQNHTTCALDVPALQEKRVLIGDVQSKRTHRGRPHEAKALKIGNARIADWAIARSAPQIEIVSRKVEELPLQIRGTESNTNHRRDQRPQYVTTPGAGSRSGQGRAPSPPLVRFDPPVHEAHPAAGAFHYAGVVSREQEGRAVLLVQTLHDIQKRVARMGVEVGRGLVRED